MKRIMLSLLLVCLLVGCNSNKTTAQHQTIEASEVIEKVTNQETFVLLITNDDCDPCTEFHDKTSNKLSKINKDLYELNYSSVDANTSDQLNQVLSDYSSWPVLMYIQNGKLYENGVYEYSLDPEGWEEWLIEQNLLPQN